MVDVNDSFLALHGIDSDSLPLRADGQIDDPPTLKYVFEEFLGIKDWETSPLGSALANDGFESVQSILMLRGADIDELTWQAPTKKADRTTTQPVPKRDKLILQAFIHFLVDYQRLAGTRISNNAICALSSDHFNEFRTRPLDQMPLHHRPHHRHAPRAHRRARSRLHHRQLHL